MQAMDVKSIPRGVYWVKIEDKEGVAMRKVIVN
jgi:hypothetical protein